MTSTLPPRDATNRLTRWAAFSTAASARAGILVSFGLGLAFAASNAAQSLKAMGSTGSDTSSMLLLFAVALAWAAVGLAIWIGVRKQPFPVLPFIGITLTASIALRLFYNANIDPEWISDFARYWQSAVDLIGGSLPITDPYQQRALPYLYPLVRVFGDTPEVLAFGNIGLLCLIQLTGYDIVRRAAGHPAAQCFTLLWIAAPEPLYSLTIPTHDLSGLALVALSAWLVATGLDTAAGKWRWRRPMLLGILGMSLGIVLVVLEIQRGLGGLLLSTLILATVAWAIIQRGVPDLIAAPRHALINLLMIACIATPLYVAGINVTQTTGLSRTGDAAEAARLRYTIPHSTSFSNGSYYWMRAFHDAFTQHHMDDLDALRTFRRDLTRSDFAEDPLGRATNAIDRLDGLYALGAGMGFYTAGLRDSQPRLLRFLQAYNHAYAFAFALFGFIGLLLLMTRRGLPPVVATLALFTALLSLGMAFFTENQPRYAYPIWLAGSVVIASALATLPVRFQPWTRQATSCAGLVAQVVAIPAVLLGLAWLATTTTYDPDDGRILTDWQFSAVTANEVQRLPSTVLNDIQSRAPETSFFPLGLVLTPSPAMSGDALRASSTVCADDAARSQFSFFLRARGLASDDGASHLVMKINGQPVWTFAETTGDKVQSVTLPQAVTQAGCSELEFELYSSGTVHDTLDSPRVEIFFPRFVP